MPFVVTIDPIGRDGVPEGQPIVRTVSSEREALAVMESVALDAHKAEQLMLVSLYDHEKRLVVSYTCRNRALQSVGSFEP